MKKILYSDLDGTMVGPGGCFFRDVDRQLTLAPAQALVDLLAAGVALVLVSGRTREQLLEACRVFGADGYIGELGSVIGWDRGRQSEVLRGDMPAALPGPPASVIADLGIVPALFARYPGWIEYHAPWHVGHEGDVMLRGRLDVVDVESWLDKQGYSWLRLRDNGVLPHERGDTLVAEARPAHVYHLMPAGLTKGLGVARDLARRGISSAEAVAVGDSASDLTMAPYVDRLFLVANGHAQPHMPSLVEPLPNVTVASGAVGLGWADAVRYVLSA
jgi:predicted mannosyl-3-phosphoglycerate phosphatase (HAD superfamily)